MKKMSPRTARNLSARTAFCLVVLVVAAFCLVACSGDEVQYVSPEGYALSGKITLDGEGLGGVEILVDGEKTAVSDDNGVFSLTGLSYGDEVAFLADGYAFSPASYTVKGTVNDLGVRASVVVVPPAEDDPETPDDPEDEDGQECTFEVINAAEVKGSRYLAVVPYMEDPESLNEDAELILMRVGTDDEGEYMDIVDDDEELLEVGRVFEERLRAMFDIDDSELNS